MLFKTLVPTFMIYFSLKRIFLERKRQQNKQKVQRELFMIAFKKHSKTQSKRAFQMFGHRL